METELMNACQTELCFGWRAFERDAWHALQVFHFYLWWVVIPVMAAVYVYSVAVRRGWLDHPGAKTIVLPALVRFAEAVVRIERRLRITGRHMRRIYNRERKRGRE